MLNLSLKTKTFIVLFLLVFFATAPLIAYYLNATRGLLLLQTDPRIEQSLLRSVELAQTPIDKENAALALTTYSQLKVLRSRIVQQVLLFSLIYSSAVVAISLFCGYILISRITRPLKNLTMATQAIAMGKLDCKLNDSADAEIGSLIRSFNKMIVDLRMARDQLAIAERRNTWQQVARTIAHEIKNPLTPIKLSTERMYEKFLSSSDDFPQILQNTTNTILSEIANLQKLVDTFARYAKFPDPVLKPENINAIITETVEMFKAEKVTIICRLAPTLPPISLDKSQIREALINIIKNSIEAIVEAKRDGEIVISTTYFNSDLTVTIKDNGCGISAEHQQRLFQPYFTTKQHGNGIGLAITERIITLNGGKIFFESEKGKGTTFSFIFKV